MNANRRKALQAIRTTLDAQRELLDSIAREETDYFDNMPDGIQQGEKGDAASMTADNLSIAVDELDSFIASFDDFEA